MLYSRNYSRLFITLKQDRSDFCYDLRPAMGRCIIEIRNSNGKIMIFAQGLKSRILYRVILVKENDDGSSGINAGLINIDEKGKGDFSINFNPNNVLSSGLKIEDIGAVLIIVDGIGEIAAPLVGFRDKNFVWKNNFKILHNENLSCSEENDASKNNDDDTKDVNDVNDINNITENINKNDDKEDNKEIVENKTENIIDNNINNNIIEEKKEDSIIKNEIKNETINKTEAKISSKSKTENVPKNRTNKITDFNSFLEKFKNDMLELEHYAFMTEADKPIRCGKGIHGIDYIIKHNQKIKPFEKCDADTQWYKILPCELTAVNANLWRHLNSPFINSCFKKYKYLILGIKKENGKNCYIVGVPEVYDKSFAAEAKKQGFEKFMPREDCEVKDGVMGYWILEIN